MSERLLAKPTLEEPVSAVDDHVAVQIRGGGKSLLAHVAQVRPKFAVHNVLVASQLAGLDETFIARRTLMWSFGEVDFHVGVPAR